MSSRTSAFLADPANAIPWSPIPVSYQDLWHTRASANRKGLGIISKDDLNYIHYVISLAAMEWEKQHGNVYNYDQSPIPHGHQGLEGAKTVPVRLNLDDGESIHSFAGTRALMNHDFEATRPTPWPSYLDPNDYERWRIYDSHNHLTTPFPARYLLWKSTRYEGLYARIPKPLEGLSRAASCDHCRIHDPRLVWGTVDGVRGKRAVDTAATPFTLCRFHWWYVWSGELLRPSHVRALEMCVREGLSERWGISHMREFLDAVESCCQLLDGGEDDDGGDDGDMDPIEANGSVPAALLNDKDDEQQKRNGPPPLEVTKAAGSQRAESPGPPIVPQTTVASTGQQSLVPGDRPASTTTADRSNDTGAGEKKYTEHQTKILRRLLARAQPQLAERIKLAGRGDPMNPRRAMFESPSRAYVRHLVRSHNQNAGPLDQVPTPTSVQHIIALAGQQTNGDPQATGDDHDPPSDTDSAPAPEPHENSGATKQAEPSLTNGQSTTQGNDAPEDGSMPSKQPAVEANGLAAPDSATVDNDQQGNDAPASQATESVAPGPVVPVAQSQNNGTPTRTNVGRSSSPPTEPRYMRQMQSQRGGGFASQRGRGGFSSYHEGERPQPVARRIRAELAPQIDPPQGNGTHTTAIKDPASLGHHTPQARRGGVWTACAQRHNTG